MNVTAILSHADEGGFVAFDPGTGTTTQRESLDNVLTNLRRAVELYLKGIPMRFRSAPLFATFDVAIHA